MLIYLNQGSGNNNEELLAYLSIVSIAIIRMLPLFNSVLTEANKLQFRFGSVKTVSEILNKVSKKQKNNFDKIFSVKDNGSLKFLNSLRINKLNSDILDKKILENINLEILKGSKIALIGSSGSGKTTLLNHISQLYEIPNNTILIDDVDIHSKKEWQN